MTTVTKNIIIEILKNTEQGYQNFQNLLESEMYRGVVTVVFLKKDGTERTMRCTLNPDLIPRQEVVESVNARDSDTVETPTLNVKPQRKTNNDVRTCWDTEAAAWRSFRWDSIKTITYDDGVL